LFQLAAAVTALMLIRVSGKRWAWIAIAIALVLMTIRRIDALVVIFNKEQFWSVFQFNEVIGLLLSILMLAGLIGIAPIFSSLRKDYYKKLLDAKLLSEGIVNTAVAGILVVDANGKVLLCNRRFIEIWNLPQEVLASNDANKFAQYFVKLVKEARKFLKKAHEIHISKSERSKQESPLTR
jgi:PAS fold.